MCFRSQVSTGQDRSHHALVRDWPRGVVSSQEIAIDRRLGLCRKRGRHLSPSSDSASSKALSAAALPNDMERAQTCARSRLDGPAAAMPATRNSVVMPMATAPMIEKTICHVSDGMASFAIPYVA